MEWRSKNVALAKPFHLSYPFLLEQNGDVLMVPESHKAGEIALYRAHAFPDAGYAKWYCWPIFQLLRPASSNTRELGGCFTLS